MLYSDNMFDTDLHSDADPGLARAPAGSAVRAVPAVSRAIAIIRLLGRNPAPMGVHAVAQALDLVPSTALHILRVLVDEGLAAFDPGTKRYSPAAGLLVLARGAAGPGSFGTLAQPALDALSVRFGLTAIGVEALGLDSMVVVAIAHAETGLRLHVDVGNRYPALISATGRCIAAFGNHPVVEMERRFRALRWDNPPTLETWQAEIAATRAAGFAVDAGQYIEGVTIIAAPVMTRRGASHGLVILGLGEQLRRIGHDTVGAALHEAAAALSQRMGGTG
jgi:DNA-binding IclR family transcriptional regulator